MPAASAEEEGGEAGELTESSLLQDHTRTEWLKSTKKVSETGPRAVRCGRFIA